MTSAFVLLKTPQAQSIRVMLVDDHPTVRRGVAMLLAAYGPRFEVVAEAATAEEALGLAASTRPDIVLTDLHMRPTDGIALMKRMRECHPALDARFIVFTSFGQKERAREAWEAGARGFVVKDSEEGELVHAIEAVQGGSLHFPPGFESVLLQRNGQSTFTDRERQVLELLAEGLSDKQIARRLGIGDRTVETFCTHIIRKAGLEPGMRQLVKFAVERNWVGI